MGATDDTQLEWRPDIEGLRGVAVLLVVLYHVRFPGFTGGFVGVDVFFVLSGFLITGLLRTELQRTGRLDLPRFYARRAQRLLPAVTAMTLFVLAFSALFHSPITQREIALTGVATAGYFSNLQFGAAATDYLASTADSNPLLHTWSLGVEEQFYLAWPVLLLAAAMTLSSRQRVESGAQGRAARRILGMTLLLMGISFGFEMWLMGTGRSHWAFFGSPARAWQFACGALAWQVLSSRAHGGAAGALTGGRGVPWGVLGWVGLGLVIASGIIMSTRTAYPGLAAILPTAGTVLVLLAGAHAGRSGAAALLAFPPVRLLGRLSYSWYLWHWPVLVFAREFSDGFPIAERLAWLLVSLGMAAVSYRWIEHPIRTSRWIRHRTKAGLALLASLTVIGLGAAGGFWRLAHVGTLRPDQQRFAMVAEELPLHFTRGCLVGFEAVEATVCRDGPVDGALRIALFGDSHAAQWGPTLEVLAREEGWSVYSLTKVSCPVPKVTIHNPQLGRPDIECDEWRKAALDSLEAIQPQLVIASTYVGYALADAEWEQGFRDILDDLLPRTGRVLLIDDTPIPGFDVPACLSRLSWQTMVGVPALGRKSCAFLGDTPANQRVAAATGRVTAGTPGVRQLSLTATICPGGECPAETGNLVVFSDDTHLSNAFAASLAPVLRDELLSMLGSEPGQGGVPRQLHKVGSRSVRRPPRRLRSADMQRHEDGA
jgi:peptidoglycan/LPS O-acetylase OafA/YrhL